MADDLIQKSAEIVTNVIAATTKCSKHKHEAVDHSAHMAHGPSHSLHDGMIVNLVKLLGQVFTFCVDDLPWWL